MKSFKKSYVIYIKAMKETHTYIILLYFQVCHLQHRLSCQGHELTGLRAARLLFFCALKFIKRSYVIILFVIQLILMCLEIKWACKNY